METIRTIKGFDHELKCRGFQYEVGKTYTANGKIELCSNGFHAIRNDVNPLVVLGYYEPVRSGKPSRYCIVDCSGDIEYDDDKLCCSSIMIVKEITLEKLHELSHEWIESHSDEVESGGYCSSLSGGDGSSLRGGYCSSLRGGYCSKFCGGTWSTFFVEIHNNNGEVIGIATAIVDGVNFKENQWYEFTDGAWRECENQDNL